MITLENCKSLYKFPVTDTLYKKFFEFSTIRELEATFACRVQAWTSSFDRKPLFNRITEAYYTNEFSAVELSGLEQLYNGLGSIAVIQSSYDYFKYLMIMSVIQRLLELTSLSLRNKIDQQNWGKDTKYWIKAVTDATPYILMYFLGYSAFELLLCRLLTVLISNKIPYKVSNFIREMDLISSDKCLKLIDFIKRNFLVMLRNVFVTYVLFDLILFKIAMLLSNDFYQNEMVNSNLLFKDNWAEIEVCRINDGFYRTPFSSNTSARNLRYITDELGWMLGKMLFDLVWALILQKVLKVKDLRDPLRTDDKFKQALQNKIKSAEKSYLQHSKVHSLDRKGKTKNFSFDSSTVYVSWQKRDNLKTEIIDEHAKRKKKEKTRAPSNEQIANQDLQEERVPLLSFDHNVRNDTFTFVRLTGESYDTANTWGVIIKDSVKPDHFSRFLTSLSSGHIGRGSIKSLKEGILELRPKAFNARLIGRLHRGGVDYEEMGAHTEEGIYKELQNYMPLEDARTVTEVLREEAKGREQTELIIFSREAQKHGRQLKEAIETT